MGEGVILVGDAGGTNVRFALARVEGGRIALSGVWKRRGADFPTFPAALEAYLAEERGDFSAAAFGLAGVVVDGRVEILNRGWTVDVAALAPQLGVSRVVVVNDFVWPVIVTSLALKIAMLACPPPPARWQSSQAH